MVLVGGIFSIDDSIRKRYERAMPAIITVAKRLGMSPKSILTEALSVSALNEGDRAEAMRIADRYLNGKRSEILTAGYSGPVDLGD